MISLPTDLDPQRVAARYEAVREAMLRRPHLRSANFERLTDADVAALFAAYDHHWFDGSLAQAVRRESGRDLVLGVSTTLSRSGGITRRRRTGRGTKVLSTTYEIAVAGRLLKLSFTQPGQTLIVGGLTCHDRLEAAQRIMEHEIVHLYELLAWGQSSCRKPRFAAMVGRFFGHVGTHHGLVTPREHAQAAHGIRIGSEVTFTFKGTPMRGFVNRVHHRATVLVPADHGQPYNDGKRYAKYYIPLEGLTPLDQPAHELKLG